MEKTPPASFLAPATTSELGGDTEGAVVLLSGGQDSTTCLFWALQKFKRVRAVAFDYGQRHRIELQAAAVISTIAGVDYHALPLEVLSVIGGSALVDPSLEVKENGGYEDQHAPEGLPSTFVPGRNLLFLSVAGAYALKHGCTNLVTGVCETDYSGYPDCRMEFLKAMSQVLAAAMPSSMGTITIHAPLMHKTKAETVLMAQELGDECWKALGHSVTCYRGWRPGCGECPSCALRAKGFEDAGVKDPALAMFRTPDASDSLEQVLGALRQGSLSKDDLILRLESLAETLRLEEKEEEEDPEDEEDVEVLFQRIQDHLAYLGKYLEGLGPKA